MKRPTLMLGLLTFAAVFGIACSDDCPAKTRLEGSECRSIEPVATMREGIDSEPEVCTEGAVRCAQDAADDRAARETCTDGAWVASEPCGSKEVCSMAGCASVNAACHGHAGEAVCDDKGAMLDCRDDGSAVLIDNCAGVMLCAAGLAARSCAACETGTSMCNGASLLTCAADGASSAATDCKSEALCDAAAGRCKQAVCQSGDYTCEGTWLKQCAADLSGWDESKAQDCGANLCDGLNKRCRKCVPGSRSCADYKLTVCDSLGMAFEPALCEPATAFCVDSDECVQCAIDQHCPARQACKDNRCVDMPVLSVADGDIGVFSIAVGQRVALDVDVAFKAASPISLMLDAASGCSLTHPGVGPGGDPANEQMQRSEQSCAIAAVEMERVLTLRGPTGRRCGHDAATPTRTVLRFEDGYDESCDDAVVTIIATPQ